MNVGTDRPVIFFDGVCNVCNASVDWVLRHDRHHLYLFAPLQGATARRTLEGIGTASIVVADRTGLHTESDAIQRILHELRAPWSWLSAMMRLTSTPLLDAVYRWIARNRYTWFGRRAECRVPSRQERSRFLE